MNSVKLENIFGPISMVTKEVSPSKYPNTVPLAKPTQLIRNNVRLCEGSNNTPAGSAFPQHSSAVPAGRRRVHHQEFMSNKNRDLAVKPSPYSLSHHFESETAHKPGRLFPWENNPVEGSTRNLFDVNGKVQCTTVDNF